MNYELVDAKYVKDFVVWVRFDDGVQGEIDLKPELYGPVFEPLLDPSQFRKFSIHPELHTLVWDVAQILPQSFYTKRRKTLGRYNRIVGHKDRIEEVSCRKAPLSNYANVAI
jgi:hypothetical protein